MDFNSFELADPNDRTCIFGKRYWRWKIYSRQNQLNAVFFVVSLPLTLFFLSQDRPPFNRWRNNGHEYPLSTHKWFIDWLFWCYISFWIRAKNTLRDAMLCDARINTFDKRIKQPSERSNDCTFQAHNFTFYFFQTHHRNQLVGKRERVWILHFCTSLKKQLPRTRYAFDELKPLPQLTRVRAKLYSIF